MSIANYGFKRKEEGWTIQKTPEGVLDYYHDWTKWLALYADTIATSNWVVPAGLTMDSEAVQGANLITAIWLSGGTVGRKYIVTNHITTTGGRTATRYFIVEMVGAMSG